MALLSVVMPAFNASATIAQAIRSVQSQTLQDWELLVVDDGSRDGTAAIVEKFAASDNRIRSLKTARNSGGPATPRNLAVAQSTGRYIAFLDADDLWHPEKAALQLSAMRDLSATFSCTGYNVINSDGQLLGSFVPPNRADYNDLLKRNTIGCLTAMYDSDRFGRRDFPDCGHEDYALWLAMLRDGGQVTGIPEITASYRLSPGSASSNKLKVAKYFWNIYHKREKNNFIRSAYMCARYAVLNRAKYQSPSSSLA